jgi:hypothetical protein
MKVGNIIDGRPHFGMVEGMDTTIQRSGEKRIATRFQKFSINVSLSPKFLEV